MGQSKIIPAPIDIALAQVLTAIKDDLDISGTKLAELAGIPRSSLNKLLKGDKPFYVQTLETICSALKVSADEVLREAEELLAARESASSRENVPPVSPVELDLSRWNVAAYTLDERDEEIEFP